MKVLICFLGCFSILGLAQAQDSHLQPQEMPYQDERFECFDQAAANRYVKDFNIDVRSFGGMELCNASVETKKLFNDLYLVENGKFASARKGETLIKGFIPADQYYLWMKSQTAGVERGNDIPYATAYNVGGYFTMQDGWSKMSTLGRVGTIVHEARHTAGYRHIPCLQGPYQGSNINGCDRDYMYGGSHAIEMEYYARVSVLGENFHPVYKKMARLMAMGRSNIFFNAPVIQKKETLLLLSADREKSYLLEDGQWIDREVPKVSGELKTTSFGAVLFDGIRAFAIDPYQNSGFGDLVVDTYSYFKILLDKPQNLKDLSEYDLGTKRYLTKILPQNKIANFAFPQGDWGAEMQIPFDVKTTTASFPGSENLVTQGLFIIGRDNSIAVFQPQNSRLQILQNHKWDEHTKRYVNLNGAGITLSFDGVLQTDGPIRFPAEKMSDMAKIPVYNGFDIVKNAAVNEL